MGYIAKGTITLDTVNDAYTVSLTKTSCVIPADFDGSNASLDSAWTQITVTRGDKQIAFDCEAIEEDNSPTVKITHSNYTSYKVRITEIPSNLLDGSVGLHIRTKDGGWDTNVRFSYTVIREATMLDWIKDWEGSKTKIGDTYIMAPKLFIGKKDNFVDYTEEGSSPKSDIIAIPNLTGVYIGPDSESTTGIYGYKQGKDVFHINSNGAFIGGWSIDDNGITTSNQYGSLQILSDGSLKFIDNNDERVWEIRKNGSMKLAYGNVMLYSDGRASFKGNITAEGGQIGGWDISSRSIQARNLVLDSQSHVVGVTGKDVFMSDDIQDVVQQYGGVYMYYTASDSYGLKGYVPAITEDGNLIHQNSFSLGSENKIANWHFDMNSLYMGSKANMQRIYASNAGDITIGSNGMRGKSWYIDSDGTASFAKGQVKLAEDDSSIVGWNLKDSRLSNQNVAILANEKCSGVFMSIASGTDFNRLASTSIVNYIQSNGGVYMRVKSNEASFAAYNKDGKKMFEVASNGISSIANWNIENDALFIGTKNTTAGAFTSSHGSITLSDTGIRGNKWRLDADGSGSLAGGMIEWDADGNMDFKAKVSADNITTGTISTANIKNSSGSWCLNQDGSGSLANDKIKWDSDGVLEVQNSLLTDVVISGTIRNPFASGTPCFVVENGVQTEYLDLLKSNNIIIAGGGSGTIYPQIPFDAKYNGMRVTIMNDDYGSRTATDSVNLTAPDDKYFYENGIAMKTLKLNPYTGIEMIGYGIGDTFKGWVVTSRVDKNSKRGLPLRVYCYGNCSDINGNMVGEVYTSGYECGNSNAGSVSVDKQGTGRYRVTFSDKFKGGSEYMVFLTGVALGSEKAGRYASVLEKTGEYFDVYCGDDDTPNDAGFSFIVVSAVEPGIEFG